MSYNVMYQAKLTTPEKLAEALQSGWTLGMDSGPSQTPALMDAFAARVRGSDLRDIKVHTMLDVYPYAFYADDSLLVLQRRGQKGGQRRLGGLHSCLLPGYSRPYPQRLQL